MSLKAGLKDRTFYAIINFASESVKNNEEAIRDALFRFSRKYGIQVTSCFETDSTTHNWDEIDRQFNIAKHGSDLLVFGGDGTQTYILNKIIQEEVDINFIGISVGTMNINAFSITLSELDYVLDFPQIIELDAICCHVNEKKYFCFIDSVVTTTCVSRINGKISQASAEGILNGHKYRSVPELVGNKDTTIVIKNGMDAISLPSFNKIYTISCAFLNDGLKARVLAGGADPSTCAGFQWGIIVSDFPLVWADVTQEELQLRAPIKSLFFPLLSTNSVGIQHLSKKAHLVIDGNVISKINSLNITYAKNVCKIIRAGGNK